MRILVTGGGGFLGQAICRMLVERGDEVVALNRSAYPALQAMGIRTERGDIADEGVVERAALGCDAIIHVAALAGPGLYAPDFHRANVIGTDRVIEACRRLNIGILVFTSSPSVVHSTGDVEGGDESLPYTHRPYAPYPMTKAESERRVLAANDATLKTCALRPRLIWGPGDNQLLPRIIEQNRAGRLRLPAPDKKIDMTYIDNAAAAHVLALDNLAGPATAAGNAYFISNGDPRPVSEMLELLLTAVGEEPKFRTVPLWLAWMAASVVEGVWRLLGKRSDPPLSRFVIENLATAHWYDLSAASRDLGYRPRVSIEEGLARLAESRVGETQ